MTTKEQYEQFCHQTYVPIFSQPWWMDAICGPENWDVWLYESGGSVLAALPYYHCVRNGHPVITKAPLTQNNGLLIRYPANQGISKRAEYEERICNEAIAFIEGLGLSVYEQQFHHSFTNHLPFFWNFYSFTPRVTYVIENTSDMTQVEKNFSSSHRNMIRKGMKSVSTFAPVDKDRFYVEHEKIYLRQNLPCPFSKTLWDRLYTACDTHDAGQILTAQDANGTVLSLAYLVWDQQAVYLLMGGAVPEYSSLQTYNALVRECIAVASRKGLAFDFEGSVIRRINHSFREYGGTPKLYYRIRKVFDPEIIRSEAEEQIRRLQ